MQHYPRAQTWWQRLLRGHGRCCAACGVRWMCDEAKKDQVRRQSIQIIKDDTGAWSAEPPQNIPAPGSPAT